MAPQPQATTLSCQSLLSDEPQPDGAPAAATLHGEAAAPAAWDPGEPACFGDLNLDQVVAAVTAGRDEYALDGLYHSPLRDVATIRYRQEVVADLQRPELAEVVTAFTEGMRTTRRYLGLAGKARYHYQRQRWRLDAMAAYCEAVNRLDAGLQRVAPHSRGLDGVRAYTTDYTAGEAFRSLAEESRARLSELDTVVYCVIIKGPRVTVREFEGEADLSEDVHATFAKFREAPARDYRAHLPSYLDLNHVEARILDLVAKLHPETFAALDRHCERFADFIDPRLAVFEREAQFYLAYLDHVSPLRDAGLAFALPEVTTERKALHACDAFDLALAGKVVRDGGEVVTNDVELHEGEHALVVTGPNQGGKTTYARMVGELCYLATLGLPVPARRATLFVPDRVFTHFEREESLETLRGKLEDDLHRVKEILDEASGDSLVVLNEAFASTSVQDALRLSERVVGKILDLGALCVYVTFLDEITRLSDRVVSLVSAVDPDDPAVRTYRVERRPADGLAYAEAIAAKHGLTYERLKERLPS